MVWMGSSDAQHAASSSDPPGTLWHTRCHTRTSPRLPPSSGGLQRQWRWRDGQAAAQEESGGPWSPSLPLSVQAAVHGEVVGSGARRSAIPHAFDIRISEPICDVTSPFLKRPISDQWESGMMARLAAALVCPRGPVSSSRPASGLEAAPPVLRMRRQCGSALAAAAPRSVQVQVATQFFAVSGPDGAEAGLAAVDETGSCAAALPLRAFF